MKKFLTIFIMAVFSTNLCGETFADAPLILNAKTSTQRIVVLGSSTAEGTGPLNLADAWVNRYRSYLQSIDPNSEVINLAKGGYTTYKIMPDGFIPSVPMGAVDPERNITKWSC